MRKPIASFAALLGLAACYPLPTPVAPPPPAPLLAAQNLRPEERHVIAPQWYDASGNLIWPPNGGFARTPVPVVLPSGMLLDRFGSPGGTYFSPQAAPYDARALPYVCEGQAYTVYRVDRPLVVNSGTAAPWFGEPGGAIQYQTGETAAQMLADPGHTIKTLSDPGPAPCDSD
jgi:nicrotizing toxin Mtb-like protein